MELKVYSVRDTKTDVFNNPFFNHTHGEAERNFRDLVNDDKTQINRYPEDYDLYHLGSYDTVTGKISPLDTPTHMIKAVSLLKQKAN